MLHDVMPQYDGVRLGCCQAGGVSNGPILSTISCINVSDHSVLACLFCSQCLCNSLVLLHNHVTGPDHYTRYRTMGLVNGFITIVLRL